MNLENLNLVELNAQELQEVEVGWVNFLLRGLALIAGAALYYHEQDCYKCRGPIYGRPAGDGGQWA